MNHFFSCIVFLFLSVTLQTQNIKGKVIDSQNQLEISNVSITNLEGVLITETKSDGSFILPENGEYIFSKEGYVSKTIAVLNVKYLVVSLETIPKNLDEIIITSNNFQSRLNALPAAVSMIDSEGISKNNEINIAPILNCVPGVFMHNGTLTTNRITIRGIGSRNLFGTTKLRAYYQDIPLTNGSGASTIEDIEMSALGRIEISKGPSSSMYGAGLGGTIQLIPNKGTIDEVMVNSGITVGSFGLQRYVVQANLGNLNNSGMLTYSNAHSDGYRDNNETDKQVITATSNHFINEANKLTFVGNYTDLKAYIPSSINENAFINDPTSAAFTWSRAKGYEDYQRAFFGLSWQHDYSLKTRQHTSVFTSTLNSYEPRPFNILNEKTNGIGLRSRIASTTSIFNNALDWNFGGEVFKDTNTYQTYENLYNDFPAEVGSVKGDLLSDFKEKRSYFNIFFDSKYQLSSKMLLTFGLNFNYTFYKLYDRFETDGIDYSGDYNFGSILSPKLGLVYDLSQNSMVYTTVSHGFSPPTLEETLLPDGVINSDIKPESGWNYEIGSRGNLFNNTLFYDVSLYRMAVKNLLVARRTANDEYIGVNAGKTNYNGIEATLKWTLLNKETFKIVHTSALAHNNFKFKDFVDEDNDYSGNKLTGVPNLTYFSDLNFESSFGLYFNCNYNYVGEIPMRDDNSIFSNSYNLVNGKLGFRSNENKPLQFDVFVGVNNIFDEKYASMLLINAGSFGGNAPRYFYPGEPVNYYTGIKLKYIL